MPRKKKSKGILILTLIIGIIIIISLGSNMLFSVFEDNYVILDDFNSGERIDVWQFYEYHKGNSCGISVCGQQTNEWFNDCREGVIGDFGYININSGQLEISAIKYEPKAFSCNNDGLQTAYVTSIKEFTTEDIKIEYNYEYRTTSDFDNYVQINNYKIPLTQGESCTRITSRVSDGSLCTNDATLEILTYDDFDLTKRVVIINGKEIMKITIIEPFKIKIGENLNIESVKYRPYFSCQINPENDVIVEDKFSEGSTITKDSLSYVPTKTCTEDLGAVIIDSEGITKEKGSITRAIAQGKEIIVPEGQSYYIRYITNYVNDMTERCNSLDKIYSTEQKKCIGSGVKQEIPTQTLLFCNKDSDCIIPSGCNDATAKCIENQCNYDSTVCEPQRIINEILVEKTIEIDKPQIIKITEGFNEIVVTNSDTITGYTFSSTKPEVLCSGEGYIKGDGCYMTHIEWNDFEFDIKNGDTISTETFDISYEMTGVGAFKGTKDDITYDSTFIKDSDWENTINIKFHDIFSISDIKYNERQELNSNSKATLTLKNNFMDLSDSGYKIKVTKSLRDIDLEFVDVKKSIPFGDSDIEIDLPTDEFSIFTVSIIPYFNIKDTKQYVHSEQITFSYYVEEEVFKCTSDSQCSVGKCIGNDCVIEDISNNNIYIFISIGAFLIVLMSIIIMVKRK